MMKALLYFFAVLVCITIALVENSPSQNSALQVGVVDNRNSRYLQGAGCSFATRGTNRYSTLNVFLADTYSEAKKAWMHIDGRVVTLRFVNSTQRSTQRWKKGLTYTEIYRAGDVTARITYVLTKMGEIESADFSAVIVVSKGSRSKTLNAVGVCGS